jgi:hypothetical protein
MNISSELSRVRIFHDLPILHIVDDIDIIIIIIIIIIGRAVAQAVRRWLPTAAVRVRIRAACGVCGGQSGTGAGFLRVLRFPLPIFPPISPSS